VKVSFFRSAIELNNLSIDSKIGNVEELENKLSEQYGNNVLVVNNIASAFRLTLSAIETKRGDKIICSVNSYPEIPQAIRSFDSEPLFNDISLEHYCIDIESVNKQLKENNNKKLNAAIISHFNGVIVNIDQILEIAKDKKVTLIEDFSDVSLDRDVKIKGDIAIFSLNYRLDNLLKGAFIVFKNNDIYERAKVLRSCGKVYSNKSLPYLYDIIDIGYDYNMSEFDASIFLKNRFFINKKREKIIRLYNENLKGLDAISLPKQNDKIIFYNIEIKRNRDFFARGVLQRGVEVGLFNIPLNFTTYYKNKYGFKVTAFKNALLAYQRVLTLPCYDAMNEDEVMYVIDVIKEVASKHV